MKLRYILISIIVMGSLMLGACNPKQVDSLAQTAVAQTLTAIANVTPEPTLTPTAEPTATNTSTPEPTKEIIASGPTDFPADVNPLTGLKVADPSILDRRPVLVKVANFPASGRPHAGLSQADIVFEYYIGEGLNRFMALYYGQDSEQIGPVRSGRLVDPQLTLMYGGVLGFKGADAKVFSRITTLLGEWAITGTEFTCPAICDNGEGFVTSIFADSSAFKDLLANRGIDNARPILDGTRFDPAIPANGIEGAEANVIFNVLDKGRWVYDDSSGKYLRWIEDADTPANMIPLVDRNTNVQLGFSNVVILLAYYTEYAPALHDIGIWDNTTSQRAIIFRDGQAFDVYWRTADPKAPIQFLDADGNIFPLKPGNSWMVLMGMNSGVSQSGDTWDFNFYLP